MIIATHIWILPVTIIILIYFSLRVKHYQKKCFEILEEKYPLDYKELTIPISFRRIPTSYMKVTLLDKRIFQKNNKLPNDENLNPLYRKHRIYSWITIGLTASILIFALILR